MALSDPTAIGDLYGYAAGGPDSWRECSIRMALWFTRPWCGCS